MIRIGIICPSEIAFRRFLPSLREAGGEMEFAAVGIAAPEEWFDDLTAVTRERIDDQQSRELAKAQAFVDEYGGEVIAGYANLVASDKIDAVYVPLPPALHFKWARKALEAGKHVFVEKPSTTCLADTDELIRLASEKGLALHENYMFVYHGQLRVLDELVKSGEIGDVRLYRISFGFPLRKLNDFRYCKALGGGALLDAGGYCLKYAGCLLGEKARVVAAQVNYIDGFEVEMYGSATMVNDEGVTAQLAFGMDNDYRCGIEIWGSKGTVTSNRVLTAPAGLVPSYTIKKNQDFETRSLPADDAFLKSILRFVGCIGNDEVRREEYAVLHTQSSLLEQFKELSNLS